MQEEHVGPKKDSHAKQGKALRITNKAFAETDTIFIAACKKVGLPATERQASKYRRGLGRAFGEREVQR